MSNILLNRLSALKRFKTSSLSDNKVFITFDNKLLLFLAWMPESTHGTKDALFIIVVEINSNTKEFIIRHLVQSPFWEPSQIDSNELRLALENQNEKQNCTTINLDYLYQNDLRYKLAWATWNLNVNNTET